MKVKIFSGFEVEPLEKKLNEWLKEHKSFKIKKIKQSVNSTAEPKGEIIISLWYEEKTIA